MHSWAHPGASSVSVVAAQAVIPIYIGLWFLAQLHWPALCQLDCQGVAQRAGALLLRGGGTSSGNFTGAGTLNLGGGTVTGNVTVGNMVFSGDVTTVSGQYGAAVW